mmetsp:Transcript_102431/g.296257  ORF Transcript_102431/g.296257 Transcript_102431/m.296257 type:complete len:219 (+) Transcript_102431:111-767(+)
MRCSSCPWRTLVWTSPWSGIPSALAAGRSTCGWCSATAPSWSSASPMSPAPLPPRPPRPQARRASAAPSRRMPSATFSWTSGRRAQRRAPLRPSSGRWRFLASLLGPCWARGGCGPSCRRRRSACRRRPTSGSPRSGWPSATPGSLSTRRWAPRPGSSSAACGGRRASCSSSRMTTCASVGGRSAKSRTTRRSRARRARAPAKASPRATSRPCRRRGR